MGRRVARLGPARRLPRDRRASDGRMLRVPAELLRDRMAGVVPARRSISSAASTARHASIESTARQRDSLVTLGTLAAGLAHELNNPVAAAASRSVDALEAHLRHAALSLAGWPRGTSTRGSSPPSMSCAAGPPAAASVDPLARPTSRSSSPAGCAVRDVPDPWQLAGPARRRRARRTSRGASRWPRSCRRGRWSPALDLGDERLDRPGVCWPRSVKPTGRVSELVTAVVPTRSSTGRRCSRSTSPPGSTARW